MANPTDHLAAVRAALDLMLRVWPGPLYVRRFVDDTGNDAAAVIDNSTGETIATCDSEDRDDHSMPVEDARAIASIRNAAPAIAAMADECERLRATTEEREADMHQRIRLGYDKTVADAWRAEVVKRDERIATLEAELAQARVHRCGGIVLSAEDADRIAALLEEQPGPTPAMLALFDKAKEE